MLKLEQNQQFCTLFLSSENQVSIPLSSSLNIEERIRTNDDPSAPVK
jgi:hypothetical protein